MPDTTQEESTDGDAGPLFHIAYVSTETRSMTQADLIELLTTARRFNQQHSLTGLLLHKGDAFFQVLEGPKKYVCETLRRIQRDSRHHSIEMLVEETLEDRRFDGWHMGFVNLDAVDLSLLPGYSEFMREDISPRTALSRLSQTERLAHLFREMS